MSKIINDWSAVCPKCDNKINGSEQVCRNCGKPNIFIKDIVQDFKTAGTVTSRFLKCNCGEFPNIKCEKCGCSINKEALLPPIRERGKSSCFVVTACYGEEHINVKLLREYRDSVLIKNKLGLLAVQFYESIGPYLAKYISNKDPLKRVCKKLISTTITLLRLNNK